jgi:hypothetical protein
MKVTPAHDAAAAGKGDGKRRREMVPPGGAGIGMHVIPVEKAIPAESSPWSIEHLSHWLKKYEGNIGVSVLLPQAQRIRATRAAAI